VVEPKDYEINGGKYCGMYLLKARTVEPEKQPFPGKGSENTLVARK
jgi:hypothetical protein